MFGWMVEELWFDYQQKQERKIPRFAAIREEDMWQVCNNIYFLYNFEFFTHILLLYGTSVNDSNCKKRGAPFLDIYLLDIFSM
jgi:hypothetical protein